MWSHPTWCLVVALSILASGSKVPRQIVYQIRPAPASALTSHDGTFLLEDGITEFQFPSFGLKSPEGKTIKSPSASVLGLTGNNESADQDSSSSSSSSSASSSPSEESSQAVTKEEITEVPTFGNSQFNPVGRQILQLQPEQIEQIFNSYKPQIQQIQQQQQEVQKEENIEVGPRYEYRSIEENANTSADDIKTAQTEAITEEKLQSAYSERREKKRRKEEEGARGDASYAFGYETDEAARHEVADPDGTVKGWYTYVDDEGTVRKIIYTAGAGKGFVVLGKEKIKGPGSASPVQPHLPQQRRKQNKPNNRVNTDYVGFAADSSTISSLKQQKPQSTPASFSNYFNNWSDLANAGTANPPLPTTVIATVESPTRTKKPVFIVKIRRPVNKDQWPKTNHNLEMAGDSSSSLLLVTPPSKYLVNGKHSKLLSDPEPLPRTPVTSLRSATRTRRRPTMTLADVVPSLRKARIKKYPTPPIYYADDDDESGYDASTSQGSSTSSSGEYDSDHDSGERTSGGGGGNYGGGRGGGGLPVKSDPDSSYVFGYETDSANRLEKADPYGNVRGSYSYIDPDGVKRTVHYVAGQNTGFQVIHASPSISRGVRLEAPPGYVVKRVPSLRTAESRYPIPITVPRPSAIVYHIHPDSGWKPWEPTLRKKKVKIHRKKLPKEFFRNAQRDGIVLLQTHPEPQQKVSNYNTAPASSGSLGAGSSNMYFKEKVTAAGTETVTQTETKVPYVPMSPPISRRRHAPQRGYTADHHLVNVDDYASHENTAATAYHHHQPKSSSSSAPSSSQASASSSTANASEKSGPGVYTPAPFESMRESAVGNRIPSPSPVQLQPTQVAIKSRGAPSQAAAGLDTSSSNHHPIAFTSDGKLQVDVPTVIIEQVIEAKSPASLVAKKDESNRSVVSVIHHKLPEAAALTQSTSPVDLAVSSTGNLVKGPTPTSRPAGYELVSASSVNYQASSAPTPAAASAPSASVQNSQKSYTPNNNHISQHHHKQSSSSLSTSSSSSVVTVSTAPPSRSRRRHHRSKTASTPTPTSSSANSASSSSSDTIKAAASGNVETTTAMSSSKRLINRLAATDHDTTVSA